VSVARFIADQRTNYRVLHTAASMCRVGGLRLQHTSWRRPGCGVNLSREDTRPPRRPDPFGSPKVWGLRSGVLIFRR